MKLWKRPLPLIVALAIALTMAAAPARAAEVDFIEGVLKGIEEMLDQVNEELGGLMTVSAEAREGGSFAIVIRANYALFEDTAAIEQYIEEVSPLFSSFAPMLGLFYGDGAKLIFEFRGVDGEVLYYTEYGVGDELIERAGELDEDASRAALEGFVADQAAAMDEVEAAFMGLIKIGVEARGSSTMVYVFTVTKLGATMGLNKGEIEKDMIPTFETMFAVMLPMLRAMGVGDPAILIEFVDEGGELIASAEIK